MMAVIYSAYTLDNKSRELYAMAERLSENPDVPLERIEVIEEKAKRLYNLSGVMEERWQSRLYEEEDD